MNKGAFRSASLVVTLVIGASLLGSCLRGDGGQVAQVKPDKSQTAFFDRPAALAAARASSTPYPLIVLLTSDPWLAVVGSDSPAFVLYSDGTAVFRTQAGFKSVKLDAAEKDGLLGSFDMSELAALAGGYEVSGSTDQPDNKLLIYGASKPFYASIYGSLDDVAIRAQLPAALVNAYDRLRHFDATNAKPWLPEKIEVMIWPYEYAPDQSIVWPERWPHLDDPATIKRGDAYSLFISSTEYPALKAVLASRKEKGAIRIDGKKWAASIRIPFAHEALWMAPAKK